MTLANLQKHHARLKWLASGEFTERDFDYTIKANENPHGDKGESGRMTQGDFINKTGQKRKDLIVFKAKDRVMVGPSQYKMRLRALASGNEGSDSGWIEVFEGIQPNDQLRIILDLDKAENTFEVRYQLGDDPTYVFYDGVVDPDYIGKFLRLGFRGTFNDPSESFEILRYQVIPEPTSLVSILVFILAGLGRRRCRR